MKVMKMFFASLFADGASLLISCIRNEKHTRWPFWEFKAGQIVNTWGVI